MTAGILLGGKGTRFVPDKCFLNIDGRAIARRQLDILEQMFDDILLVGDYDLGRARQAGVCPGGKVRAVKDVVARKAALGGIYSGLKACCERQIFILAGDMPCIDLPLARYMAGLCPGYDAVVPEFKGRLQPLFAFYARSCLGAMREQMRQGNLRICDLFSCVKTYKVSALKTREFDPQGLSFMNINRKGDYKCVLKMLSGDNRHSPLH